MILLSGTHPNIIIDRDLVNGLQTYSPSLSYCVDRTEDSSVLVLSWVSKILGMMRTFALKF